MVPAETTHDALAAWRPGTTAQRMLRDEYLVFLADRGDDALDRDGGREHLTASCFVFDQRVERVLLTLHRKGGFWVQLGGHVERSDDSLAGAAFREAVEEGGIAGIAPWSDAPVDVDRHALGGGFGRCAVHWDVGFVAVAPDGAVPVVSDESDDVRWWPVDALPEGLAPGFAARLEGVLDAVR